MTTLRAGSATDVGRIRNNNQDSFRLIDAADTYVVADGMGGHQGGEVASALAVEEVEANLGAPTLEDLKESVRRANRKIFTTAGGDVDLHGMGTTTCAVRLVPSDDGDEIAWVNVGDSRIYLLRDDRLIQLSRDHSLVEDLLRDGQITADEAAVHPQRNILTRALGIDLDVDVDGGTVLPFTGDRFLLCSDGLFNEVTEPEMRSTLRNVDDPEAAAQELVRMANDSGGRDNITVVIVEVVDDGGRAEAASALIEPNAHADPTLAIPLADELAPASFDPSPEPDVQAFPDDQSSLPDTDDDYGADNDDLYADLDRARGRRLTGRVLLFFFALLVIAAVAAGAMFWQAKHTYYVGFRGQQVVIYQGKPGGVLGVDPKVVDSDTKLIRSDLDQATRDAVRSGVQKSSESEARAYTDRLFRQVADRKNAATTTTTTAPTTTTPPVTAIVPSAPTAPAPSAPPLTGP
jgi:serine/threonine protein phosphatase PrpC